MIFSGISACANSDFRMCKNMAKRVMQQVARATNNIMVVVLVVEFKTQGTQIEIVIVIFKPAICLPDKWSF
jgi:hypothetical protein